jgi:D-alanine--poly(phosphoribitol) ligase subunit 1
MIDGVRIACCIYDKRTEKIVLYYVGDLEPGGILTAMKDKLPRYMLPNLVEPLDSMPLTANAKIDRTALKEFASQRKKEKSDG